MTKDNTLAKFPQTLKQLPRRWILWRLETRDGAQTKVPYRIDGLRASPTNPNDWTDFETACRAFDPEKYNGLGFVLTKEDGIVCIDLDGCIGDDGKISDKAMYIVKILNSWTEISQSGKGLHIFVRGTKPTDQCKVTLNTPEIKAIEVYDNARYIALTGNHLPGTPLEIMERQWALNDLYARYFPKQESTPPQAIKPHHDLERGDEEIIALCRKAKNAEKFEALFDHGDTSRYAGDESRADEALACLLAFYTRDAAQIERLMNASALARREKWREREGYRRLTIQKALDYTREHYDPNHNAMTRNEAANAKPIDQSMQEDPLEKKYPLESLTPQPHHVSLVTSPPQRESDPLPMKPCNAWFDDAKALPPITPLFDVFWCKGELAFLFGETGVGKSILAVQIADAISRGEKIQVFDGPQKPMRVGYFAFELSASHLLKRYSDDNLFSDNFLIFEIDPRLPPPKGVNFQDLILQEIEQAIIENGIEVVVIDSLTAMPDATKDALELMRKLRLLKMRQNISMLVIGRTPKRDLSRPLTEDDMADLKHLINFCDSVFALGKSVKGKNVRYLIQIKCSSVELKYGSGNVATFRTVKRDRLNGF